MKKLIFYSKPGCHLCEGLAEKLAAIETVEFELEERDITTNEAWFSRYQYEIPVLCLVTVQGERELPRFSPRMSVERIASQLAGYFSEIIV